ncbi:MAG TPA: hypothetical protein VLC12_02365 [Terriglobales bacterium]|nr:hypothetical protein [Terriglobales bacterium]
MRKLTVVAIACGLFLLGSAAFGQQLDVAFGLGGLSAPSTTVGSPTGTPVSISEGGGVYPDFSGDFLFKKDFGVGGEIAWRGGQATYGGIAPYRPVFYDVYAVYAPKFSKVTPELRAGIGAESLRFYQPYYNCSVFGGCTNYTSSNHLMGVVGAGLRLYVWGHMFVRPEADVYLIRNNVEFNTNHVIRYGASVGYTFGSFSP